MRQKRGKGRPPKYVQDNQGRPIVGLSYDKANNRYFNTHWKSEGVSKETFGSDYHEAIFSFRRWEADRNGENAIMIDAEHIQEGYREEHEEFHPSKDWIASLPQEVQDEWKGKKHVLVSEVETAGIPESLFWQHARELILSDIVEARKRLNLPIVLDGPIEGSVSITLDEIGKIYFERRRKPISDIYRKDGLRFWGEFKRVTNVKKVGELSATLIDGYENWVYASAKTRHWSPATINNRLGFVKAVFNEAFRRVRNISDKQHIKNVREFCNSFTYTDKPVVNPQPISKTDYLTMLDAAKDKVYRAIMLLSLNCGMKESAAADVRITPRRGRAVPDIDLDKGVLAMPRPKTGIIRVAVLWDRTIAAIKEVLATRKSDSEFLFLNHCGNPMQPRNIRKWWHRTRKQAGVSASVKFEHIRDATQTIPLDDDPKSLVETNLIMGHAVSGMANNYLERRPTMVRRACKAIEEHFWGDEDR